MVYEEPIAPTKPEQSKDAKHCLTIALALGIAAIAKEKGLTITQAEVSGGEPFKMTIEVMVKSDKENWDAYEEARSEYSKEWHIWDNARICEIYKLTKEQREEAKSEYFAYRKETGYKYPEERPEEWFYQRKSEQVNKPAIIEVA